MIQVSPSILSADFVNLERDVRALPSAGADYVHVDVMDGNFVPNITIGQPVVTALRRVSELPLDVHLMIDRPIRYVEQFCRAGASILTIHPEADTEENTRRALEIIQSCGVTPAVSIKPKTSAEAVLPFLDLCGLVLVMTVEPGGPDAEAAAGPQLYRRAPPRLPARGRRRRECRDREGLHRAWRERARHRIGLLQGRGPGCLCPQPEGVSA